MIRIHSSLLALLAICAPTQRAASQAPQACRVEAGAPRLDHAVLVVANLHLASESFRVAGFRIKEGRVHSDSLQNRHVKFRDGTGIELMTLAGRPGSAMARRYAGQLSRGDGGIFAALWTEDVSATHERLSRANIVATRAASGPWVFLSFAARPELDAVFIGAGPAATRDTESIVSHENGAQQLSSAWIEAGPSMDSLLAQLGARECGVGEMPDGRRGSRWRLSQGTVVVVRPHTATGSAALLGIEVNRDSTGVAASRLLEPIKGFWVLLK